MQTFKIEGADLVHMLHYDYKVKEYLINIVCKKHGLDVVNGRVTYDLAKGEFTYEASEQLQPEDKSSQSGDIQTPPSGDVQHPGDGNG